MMAPSSEPARSLTVCLDAFFPGGGRDPSTDLKGIADSGVHWIEFWDWRERPVERLGAEASRLGLGVAAFSGNTFAEPLLDRGRHEAALVHLQRSLEVAARLDARVLVVHVGYALPDPPRAVQWAAAVAGLRTAGGLAGAAGITLAVEPLNSRVDHPGYFLDTLTDAVRLVEEVAHPAVRLLLDIYHLWVMHGTTLLRILPAAAPLTAHVHLADAPGRHEPGSGTIPWRAVLRGLRDAGYVGALGLECWPTGAPADAIAQTAALLNAAQASEAVT